MGCRWRCWATSSVVWALASLVACNEGNLLLPEANQPAAITLLQGNAQTAIAGGTLPESLIVRVTDSRKLPVAQIRVAFVLMTPTAGGSGSGSRSPDHHLGSYRVVGAGVCSSARRWDPSPAVGLGAGQSVRLAGRGMSQVGGTRDVCTTSLQGLRAVAPRQASCEAARCAILPLELVGFSCREAWQTW